MRPLILSILVFLSLVAVANAAPGSRLVDEHWLDNDPDSKQIIDHSAWDVFLEGYVSHSPDGINRVSYAAVSGTDRRALDSYVTKLAAVKVTGLNRDEQRAYWINLYNALTVKVILDHYPVKSIKDIDISPGFFSFGPWDAKLLVIEGRRISLNNIEHGILRPIWKDPRVHYAVNCASIGCPNLKRMAYTAANMEDMLESGAKEYINHPRGARVEQGRLIVSSIYEWFQEDFGGSGEGVISHLRKYADNELKRKLEGTGKISDDQYDWGLNLQ